MTKSKITSMKSDLKIAPNFKSAEPSGKIFELYKILKKNSVLLVFYRGYWCGSCRAQLKEINNHLKDFLKAGVMVATISADRPLEASLLKNFLKLKFPVLPDAEWKIFELFGLPRPEDAKKIKPALFLINKKRRVVFSHIGKNFSDRPRLKSLLKKQKV